MFLFFPFLKSLQPILSLLQFFSCFLSRSSSQLPFFLFIHISLHFLRYFFFFYLSTFYHFVLFSLFSPFLSFFFLFIQFHSLFLSFFLFLFVYLSHFIPYVFFPFFYYCFFTLSSNDLLPFACFLLFNYIRLRNKVRILLLTWNKSFKKWRKQRLIKL